MREWSTDASIEADTRYPALLKFAFRCRNCSARVINFVWRWLA